MTVSVEFVNALLADFEQHGAPTIARVRVEEPHIFLRLMAATVPKQLTVKAEVEIERDSILAILSGLKEN